MCPPPNRGVDGTATAGGIPFDQLPRYLLRDRDRIFGDDFREQVRDMGICEVLSAPRSPWQRAYVERVIGSIRRECLDYVIVFHESSLRRTLHFLFRLLSPISFVGEGLTREPASGNGIGRGATAGRWTAPPLRTTGCLKSQSLPGCALALLGSEITVRMCSLARPRHGGSHSADSSWAANCSGFAVRLGKWDVR
jgi:hypothetical protein